MNARMFDSWQGNRFLDWTQKCMMHLFLTPFFERIPVLMLTCSD